MNSTEFRMLKLADVQRILNMGRYAVLSRVRQGELPAAKVGREWRFDPRDVEAYIRRQKQEIVKPLPGQMSLFDD